jgi:hypothetical protein
MEQVLLFLTQKYSSPTSTSHYLLWGPPLLLHFIARTRFLTRKLSRMATSASSAE